MQVLFFCCGGEQEALISQCQPSMIEGFHS